jgi:hypothetical protein
MSDDESPTDEIDRLLDAIRCDWRRLGAASTDFEKRRLRKAMQAAFDALQRRLQDESES